MGEMEQNIKEQRERFEKTMKELQFLKCVSNDLKEYKKMVKIKKYD
jgi:hypothetical protein